MLLFQLLFSALYATDANQLILVINEMKTENKEEMSLQLMSLLRNFYYFNFDEIVNKKANDFLNFDKKKVNSKKKIESINVQEIMDHFRKILINSGGFIQDQEINLKNFSDFIEKLSFNHVCVESIKKYFLRLNEIENVGNDLICVVIYNIFSFILVNAIMLDNNRSEFYDTLVFLCKRKIPATIFNDIIEKKEENGDHKSYECLIFNTAPKDEYKKNLVLL